MSRAWVYVLRCADGSYYVGSTTNLHQRIGQHDSGMYGGYTAARRPVKLVWSKEFSDVRDAIEAERKLKKWTRAKKEALMNGDFDLLRELSRSTKTKKKLSRT